MHGLAVSSEVATRQGSHGGDAAQCVEQRLEGSEDLAGHAHHVQPWTIKDEARQALVAFLVGSAQMIHPQRGDQATGGVGDEDDLLIGDGIKRGGEVCKVQRQVRNIVPGLTRAARAAAFAEIDGIKVITLGGKVLGYVGVEEIIGHAV